MHEYQQIHVQLSPRNRIYQSDLYYIFNFYLTIEPNRNQFII